MSELKVLANATTDKVGYSTVTRCAGVYFWFRNPGRRRTRLQSVQAGSPPKVMASSLSRVSCCSNGMLSTRQSTWYLPGEVETIAVGIGTVFECPQSGEFRLSIGVQIEV